MSEDSTISTLIELAIRSERAAQAYYLGLADLFAHEPEVAAFWRMYAGQEHGHATWLERLRERSAPETLNRPADPHMLTAIRHMFRFSPDRILAQIETLEHAFQQAVDLENSETNTVFDFLIVHYPAEEETPEFLRAHLGEHIALLETGFPAGFRNAANRGRVKAQRVEGKRS